MRLRPLVCSFAFLAVAIAPVGAQTHTTLYSFSTSSSAFPESGLAFDLSGNLVGTRQTGGASGVGTVFRISGNDGSGYTYSSLFDFTGPNGSAPQAGVIMDSSGNFFGTTATGGANGRGTVFRLTDNGAGGYTHSILFSFTNTTAIGRNPAATLLMDASGNLYGTASAGGSNGAGTVFRLASDGAGNYVHATLHNFTIATAGIVRKSSLIADTGGSLYGTTEAGGTGPGGTVYRLQSNGAGGYTYATLANLNASTGRAPMAGLVADAAGNLYSMANAGSGGTAYGTIFKLSDNGAGGYTAASVHNFDYTSGANPMAGLIADAVGNLFGTTYGGGGATAPGTVFRLSDNGAGGYTHTVLFTFDGTNGARPYGDLVADDEGNLYGMTQFGGTNGHGTIFRIANAGFVVAETVATPEPATLALVGVALTGLAARRRPRAA